MTKLFKKWNDLNQFHEVRKNLNYPRIWQCLKDNDFRIAFGLKIKLHGTNACVRIEPDGKVVAQKRSSDASEGHFGFAGWVADNETYFASLANVDATRYIYGEWCGPGVQQGVACSMTEDKFFYPFAIDEAIVDVDETLRYYDPQDIETMLGTNCPNNIIVVPWFKTLWIDFEDMKQMELAMLSLNKDVEDIGEKDPFINELFGIEGPGEGLVAYPLLGRTPNVYHKDEEYFSWFNFKAKSEHHRVNKTKTAVQFDAEKFASIQAFADFYVTEPRLLQGLAEGVQNERLMSRTPDFIRWVVSDIYKESVTEREANPELDWKVLSKACSTRAVLWFKAKVQELV
jgi:hypothetical protein